VIALAWFGLGVGVGVGGCLGIGHWLARDRGPSWSEIRVLDAWTAGREVGRREILVGLMWRRGARQVTARVDPAQGRGGEP
jgi:hypothetical protein